MKQRRETDGVVARELSQQPIVDPDSNSVSVAVKCERLLPSVELEDLRAACVQRAEQRLTQPTALPER